MSASDRSVRRFEEAFSAPPETVVRAPGRVNLIGEHTDYNDGFVLPVAIDRDLCVSLRRRSDRRVHVRSEGSDGTVTVSLDRFDDRVRGWGDYVQGVAWALANEGYDLAGWEGVVASDIPVGAGLASSAALELAAARAFQQVSGFAWEPDRMARLCQRAENEWVGVASGIMDQVACVRGRRGHAVLLDCRSLDWTLVPVPGNVAIVILDTTTRRELASSAYNDRREECRSAADALGVTSLRELSERDLVERRGALTELSLRRVRHVVTENARTLRAVEALRAGDAGAVGRLMAESHRSLRDDFEVSSEALDAIVAATRGVEGCFGARLTGAGFAGCAVALVEGAAVPEFEREVSRAYRRSTGLTSQTYVCFASDGASALPLSRAEA